GRPDNSQRLRTRVADELRGSSASLRVAAKRSSIGLFLSRAIALRRERRPEYFLLSLRRRLFFSIELFFAINVSWLSAFEGGPHCRNGKLNAVNSARASLSDFALVQTVTSMPQTSAALS